MPAPGGDRGGPVAPPAGVTLERGVVGALLAAGALGHFLALTPLTNSLDDIKWCTMWLGGAAAALAFAVMRLRATAAALPLWAAGAALAHLAVLVLATLLAPTHAHWIGWQTFFFYATAFGFLFLGAGLMTSPRSLRLATQAAVVVALVTTGIGLFHKAGGMERLRALMPTPDLDNASMFYLLVNTFAESRLMISTILNTQFFGNFLGLLLPMAMAELVVHGRGVMVGAARSRGALAWFLVVGAANAMIVACMFLTFSKNVVGMIPMVLVAFPLLAWAVAGMRVRIPAWPVAVVLSIALGATVLAYGRVDMRRSFSPWEDSVSSRSIMADGAWRLFLERPVAGWGPGSYRTEFPRHRAPDYHRHAISNLALTSHNRVLDLLAESGALGLLTYAALVAGALAMGLVAARRAPSPDDRLLVIGLVLGVTMAIIGSLVTPMVTWPVGAVQLHLALGLLIGGAVVARAGGAIATPAPAGWRAGATVAGLVAAIAMLATAWWWSGVFFRASIRNNDGLLAVAIAEGESGRTRESIETADAYYTKAAQAFEDAVSLNPTFITSYYKLASAYNRLGVSARRRNDPKAAFEFQARALDAYARLRRYAPDYSEVHYNEGLIALLMAEDMNNAAQRAGDPAAAATARAEAAGLYARAQESIDRATTMSTRIATHTMAGEVHQAYAKFLEKNPQGTITAADQWRRCGEAFARAAALDPSPSRKGSAARRAELADRDDARARAPECFEKAGDWADAAQAWLALAAADRTDANAVTRASIAFERAGDRARAGQVIAQALARNPLQGEWLLREIDLALGADPVDRAAAAALIDHARKVSRRLPEVFDADQRRLLDAYGSVVDPAGPLPPT